MSVIRADPFTLKGPDDAYAFEILKGDVERLALGLIRLKAQLAALTGTTPSHLLCVEFSGTPAGVPLTGTASVDTDSAWSGTTFTVQTAGRYALSFNLTLGMIAAIGGVIQYSAGLTVNGSTVAAANGQSDYINSGAPYTQLSQKIILTAKVGDAICVYAAGVVIGGATGLIPLSAKTNWLTATWLGQ